jgi:N-acetyl-gamma-glutamyl-phosphate reductase
LALAPVSHHLPSALALVTGLTGASGSGIRPRAGTHFPDRDGNVRAYKVFRHQHVPEVQALLGTHVAVQFVPVSGPWTRGIWGTVHLELPFGIGLPDVHTWFYSKYGAKPFVRLWPESTPEMRFSVGTPFCDIGWHIDGRSLVIVFSLDNLLKGAASQAVQNANLLLGLPEERGLIPSKNEDPVSQKQLSYHM